MDYLEGLAMSLTSWVTLDSYLGSLCLNFLIPNVRTVITILNRLL